MVKGNFLFKIVKISLTALIIHIVYRLWEYTNQKKVYRAKQLRRSTCFYDYLICRRHTALWVHSKKIHDMQPQFNLSAFGQMKAESPLFSVLSLDTVFCRISVLPSLYDRWY